MDRLILGLILYIAVASAKPICPPCDKTKCIVPLNCKDGKTVTDECGCCSVCSRVEGEECGGVSSELGVCGKGLMCKVRHPNSIRNSLLPSDFKIGRCEPDECKSVECGMHQWCTYKDGQTRCECPIHCKDTNDVVCGLNDGKEYPNYCAVRKAECKHQKKIGYLPGPCKKCEHNGMIYKFGEALKTERMCEIMKCNHGIWVKSLDEKCLNKEGFSCSHPTPVHIPLVCEKGSECNITKTNDDESDGYPHLGYCVKREPDMCFFGTKIYKAGEDFVSEDCTSYCKCDGEGYGCVSLCPPELVNCDPGFTKVEFQQPRSVKPECYCTRHKCVNNTVLCARKQETGPCFGHFERWYHDAKTGKCMDFVYGGCRSNGNNFLTKAECESKCVPSIPTPTGPKMVVPGSDFDISPFEAGPPGDEDFGEDSFPMGGEVSEDMKPKMTNTTITIRGRVIFPRIPGKLPEGSCLNVRFSDTSMQDASSIELASAQLNVSGMNMAKQFNFMLESNKPAEEENWRTLSIDAVLNVGWCPSPDSDEWVRKGDYLTDTNFRISMTHELVYDKDLPVICYSCDDEDKDVEEGDSDEDDDDDESENAELEITPPVPGFPEEKEPTEHFGEYGDHQPDPPKYSDKDMLVYGSVVFDRETGPLPEDSCLWIKFKDVSLQDASSVTIDTVTIPYAGQNIKDKVKYQMKFKKPVAAELWRTFSVSAVLNVGWCADLKNLKKTKEWIREGDYLSDTRHGVAVLPDIDNYETDIKVRYYCHSSDCSKPQRSPLKTCVDKVSKTVFKNGQSWKPDACSDCTCEDGLTVCSTLDCPMSECDNPIHLVGECCPSCPEPGCFDKETKRNFKVGEKWQSKDACTKCECTEFGPMCMSPMCAIPPCPNGRLMNIEGVCCPVCSNANICREKLSDKIYIEGNIWQQDDCTVCKCTADGISCYEPNMETKCSYPIQLSRNCKKFCLKPEGEKTCKDRDTGKKYESGETWDRSPCEKCACEADGTIDCRKETCEELSNCTHRLHHQHMCCPVCMDGRESCTFDGKEFMTNDHIVKEDHCTICKCSYGEWKCASDKCKTSKAVCNKDGKKYSVGETTNEGCNSCFCTTQGLWACTMKQCPKPTTLPTTVPQTCMHDNKVYNVGETRMDDCNTCSCAGGGWACTIMACPDDFDLKNATCEHSGVAYKEGDEREDDCNTCTCLSGDWTCTEMYCGSGIKCEHEGTEYDEWEAREDDCKICTCVEGAWSCDDAGCDTTVTAKAKAHGKIFDGP